MSVLDERARAEVRREAHDSTSKIAGLIRRQLAHLVGMNMVGGKWLGPSVTLPTPGSGLPLPAATTSGVPGTNYPDGTTIEMTADGQLSAGTLAGGAFLYIITPPNGSVNVSPTVTFTWTDIATATSYHLQVDTDTSFASPVIDITTSDTFYTPALGVLLGSTVYFARVNATTPDAGDATSSIINDGATGDSLTDRASGDTVVQGT